MRKKVRLKSMIHGVLKLNFPLILLNLGGFGEAWKAIWAAREGDKSLRRELEQARGEEAPFPPGPLFQAK